MNSKKVIPRVGSMMELGCPMMELGFIIWLSMVFWCFSHQDSGGYEVLIAPRWLVRHLFCVFFSWTFCLVHFGWRVKHRSFHGISIWHFISTHLDKTWVDKVFFGNQNFSRRRQTRGFLREVMSFYLCWAAVCWCYGFWVIKKRDGFFSFNGYAKF